ncbi:putative heme-binding domain-containing protein [bacterium A37T11]|nr:putative heme-binding domain-containing protein [bacterium A37T11]
MFKIELNILYGILLILGIRYVSPVGKPLPPDSDKPGLRIDTFAGPDLTPSPACLAVAATGEVFVGVDRIGSLGKKPGQGAIIRLIDRDNDGKADEHTQFALVDNPRGILAIGDQVFVLHTVFKDSLATGMDLVVFDDKDHNGLADGDPKTLVRHMSSTKYLQERGTDHATNGIRMGIDGWIYIAVGDFGFHDAVDAAGDSLTMMGGGIVRVRPDGTEMEMYTHGLRNIYDVAIDPYMNIFTRDNTNDGGGWNIRFSHQIQSGEYGYPLLFKHFTEEIIPALADLGGGSGTGALYMAEPSWPAPYNNVPMMSDWGTNHLYIHRLSPDGPTFTQKDEEFIKIPQITDVDVDGSGRMYLSAWDGAGYSGSPDKGFVVRVVPEGWKYSPYSGLQQANVTSLVDQLKSASAVARLDAQQALLKFPSNVAGAAAWGVASNTSLPLANRVAGIFTYAQVAGESAIDNLVLLTQDKAVQEFALRALTDRKPFLKNVPIGPFLSGIKDSDLRVQATSIISLGRLGRGEAIPALLQVKVPASFVAPPSEAEGPHATPNAAIVLPHLAVRALLSLHATDACLAAIGGPNTTLALWVLRYVHEPKAVNGLINAYRHSADPALKKNILTTLTRLYKKEFNYQGVTWWSTRPDGHGPYYNPIDWEMSPAIKTFLRQAKLRATNTQKSYIALLNEKQQIDLPELGNILPKTTEAKKAAKVDLNAIKSKKGQVGKSSIEDVMLAIAKIKGNPATGKALFTRQGCVACHSITKGQKLIGPYMGQIGNIMNKEQIAESILKPNASISQGFATNMITAKGGKSYMGFVTAENARQLILQDMAGQSTTIKTADILTRKELPTSMMPTGLANALSYEELASLVEFLSQQKK